MFRKLQHDPLANLHIGFNRIFRHIAPELAPMRLETFLNNFENFHGKLLTNDAKKLHLNMIEGK